MEQWLYTNALEIVVFFGMGVLAFVKMNSFTKEITTQVKGNTRTIQKHFEDETPHLSCGIEMESRKNINDRLGRIERKLDDLDSYLRNGRRRDA